MLLKGFFHLFKINRVTAVRQEYFLENVFEDFISALLELIFLIELFLSELLRYIVTVCVCLRHLNLGSSKFHFPPLRSAF